MKFLGGIVLCFIQLIASAQQDTSADVNNLIPKATTNPKVETTLNKTQKLAPVKIQNNFNTNSLVVKPLDSTRFQPLIQKNKFLPVKVDTSAKGKVIYTTNTIFPAFDSASTGAIDSNLLKQKDSIAIINSANNEYSLLKTYPILNNSSPEFRITSFRNNESKDYLFYLLLFVTFLVALVQAFFPKYLINIFDIFFQPSFRQRQTRDQLTQEFFAIFLLNFLFVLSASIFLTLISTNQTHNNKQFWQFLLLSIVTLSLIYGTKYSFTRFIGWVFNQQTIAESYNFLIFLINKIIGVVLVPLVFLISYSSTELKQFSITVSFIIIGLLLIYRFIKTVTTLRQLLKVSGFHFFIYFCSVEILPLFILFKAIGKYIGNGI